MPQPFVWNPQTGRFEPGGAVPSLGGRKQRTDIPGAAGPEKLSRAERAEIQRARLVLQARAAVPNPELRQRGEDMLERFPLELLETLYGIEVDPELRAAGRYDGAITVNDRARHSTRGLLDHELGHHIQGARPESFDATLDKYGTTDYAGDRGHQALRESNEFQLRIEAQRAAGRNPRPPMRGPIELGDETFEPLHRRTYNAVGGPRRPGLSDDFIRAVVGMQGR